MMWFRPEVRRILAYSKPVELRKSIDGLVGVVKSVLEAYQNFKTLTAALFAVLKGIGSKYRITFA